MYGQRLFPLSEQTYLILGDVHMIHWSSLGTPMKLDASLSPSP
uniref:Uncharacterized protein n=1 Tax=Anguilla anguilla TaxID=7936 RepID=A0A0E9TUH8_ANGAN